MKKILLASAILALGFNAPARADVIDMSTVKCSDIASMSKEDVSYLLIWLHGYFGGKVEDTTIDLAALESSGAAIGEKCGANPDLGLMTAIQQLAQ
jgi:acid stress chaperone HdeB